MRHTTIYLMILMLGISTLFFSSYQIGNEPEFTEEDMLFIQEEIEKRILAFKQKKNKECQEELIERVDAKVDSLLMYNAQELLFGDDTVSIKPKPNKPSFPEVIRPDNDAPLAPLIGDEDSLLQDVPVTSPPAFVPRPQVDDIAPPEENSVSEPPKFIPNIKRDSTKNKFKDRFKKNGKKLDSHIDQ